MALIGRIRNHLGWLMLLLVALGVVGFLLMDATGMGGGSGMGGGRETSVVGAVNGDEIMRSDMEQVMEDYEDPRYISEEIQAYAWEQLLQQALLTQQVQKVGLHVTSAELEQLFVGEDRMISPMVRQYFGNPQTGEFDREQVRQRITSIKEQDMEGLTAEQQSQVVKMQQALSRLEERVAFDRQSSKYLAMLQKGMYTPNWMVESEYKRENQTYNFSFVRVPYSAVGNDQIQVTDADLEKHLQENAKKYKREASASIEYVTFNVRPSAEDSLVIRNEMDEVTAELIKSQDDTATVLQFDGKMNPEFFVSETMDEPLFVKDSLFAAETKTVIGPYIHNNEYRVIKLLEKKVVPDSIRSRHILRPVKTQEEYIAAQKLLDSLKIAIKKGQISFDSAAAKYGTDGTALKGGDLGYYAKGGGFVAEFENHILYNAKKDSLDIVATQFGLHLIQVTDYKFIKNQVGVRLAQFSKPIIPSSNTVNSMRVIANDFVVNNKTIDQFQATAKAKNLPKSEASGLEYGGFTVTGLGKNSSAAKIIRWAHREDVKEGDVAREPYPVDDEQLIYTKQFVVPALVARSAKGTPSLKDPSVRREIERVVQNEKKAEIIKKNTEGLTNLQDVATKYNVQVETTTNPVSYNSAYIVGAGAEPKVVAVANMLPVNQSSKAIVGEQGVYFINVIIKNEAQPMADPATARRQVAQRSSMVLSQGIFEELKDKADIEDNRYKIY